MRSFSHTHIYYSLSISFLVLLVPLVEFPYTVKIVNFLLLAVLAVILHRGDHDQQILDVGDAVHQIRCDAGQIFVGKLARREDVHHVRRLGASGRGNVHDAGRLLLLEVRDEAGLEVVLLL